MRGRLLTALRDLADGLHVRGELSALALQRMGTRAVVAEALVAEAASVDRAVRLVCTAAGNGDLHAAKALIPRAPHLRAVEEMGSESDFRVFRLCPMLGIGVAVTRRWVSSTTS